MAQAIKLRMPVDKELLPILKVDNHGWDITLFEDTTKMTTCLCEHCKSVCCDPVELGCDHDDDEIYLYCKQCLNQLITDNDGKCIIDSHENPSIITSRATRRQISKSIVVCPYSVVYKQRSMDAKNKNDEQLLMDTAGNDNVDQDSDEKEGAQPVNHRQNRIQIGCEWKGTFKDLINEHLKQCAIKSDPSFAWRLKVKELEKQNQELRQENILLKESTEWRLLVEKDALIQQLQTKIKKQGRRHHHIFRQQEQLIEQVLYEAERVSEAQVRAKEQNDEDHWLCGICDNEDNTFADKACRHCCADIHEAHAIWVIYTITRQIKQYVHKVGPNDNDDQNDEPEGRWECNRCGYDGNWSGIEICGGCLRRTKNRKVKTIIVQ